MPKAKIQGNLRSAVSKTTKTINQTLKMPKPKIAERCRKRMSNLTISSSVKKRDDRVERAHGQHQQRHRTQRMEVSLSADRRAPHLKLWCNAASANVTWPRAGSPLGADSVSPFWVASEIFWDR